MAKREAGSTPAMLVLTKLGVPYEVRSYRHDPSETDFGGEAARELGVDPERVFKTLLAEVDGTLAVAVVPVTGKLDLKALAAACGGKRAQMADLALAEKKTGYVVGGISPLGQRSRLRTVVDSSALAVDSVLVSGGRRGLDIELRGADLVRATNAVTADIGRV
ncbi:Cys-tRNA(Pro) deacylase [Leucobacter sp. BZR 635]